MSEEELKALKDKAEALRVEAEQAWHKYACECELGFERERAFAIYENIRTARRR